MKTIAANCWVFVFILLVLLAGCEPMQEETEPITKAFDDSNGLAMYSKYAPSKIYILPLTELVRPGSEKSIWHVKIYVSLLDSFGSQVKSPGIFRFELYEYVQRSARPRGKRIAIWPDVDLTNPVENNNYWRDFLRVYEFKFPFESERDKSYMLQVTCLCPNGKRLIAELALKPAK